MHTPLPGSTMLPPATLSLLRCPVTRQPLRLATTEEKQRHGIPESEQALVTEDGQISYRTVSDMPVLLAAAAPDSTDEGSG